jgi:hypothetical protein
VDGEGEEGEEEEGEEDNASAHRWHRCGLLGFRPGWRWISPPKSGAW